MSRIIFENKTQIHIERNPNQKNTVSFSMQQMAEAMSPPRNAGKQPAKFLPARGQFSARMPFLQHGSASSQSHKDKLVDINSRQGAVLGTTPSLLGGKPPIWAGSGSLPQASLPTSEDMKNSATLPLSTTDTLTGTNFMQARQNRLMSTTAGPDGASTRNGLDVENGQLALIQSNSAAFNPNAAPAIGIGFEDALQERAVKPAVKSAKQVVRMQQRGKSQTNHYKQQRRRLISEGLEGLHGPDQQLSFEYRGQLRPQQLKVASAERAEAQYSFKPQINDMRRSPFLAPVLSQLNCNGQSQSKLQKVYPKFIDKVFAQQIHDKRNAVEEALPVLEAYIGTNGLILPPHKLSKKMRSCKQKGKAQRVEAFGERGQSNPPLCDPMGLGIQGSQMMQKSESLKKKETHRSQMSNSAAIQMYKGRMVEQKRFFMNLGYPDLRAALLRRGWVETNNKHDETVDLKFTLSSSDIEHHRLASGVLINHCRAEGSMTCKTSLIETLTEAQHYWASWLADKETGYANISIKDFDRCGVDAFFPKSFIISSLQDQAMCFEEMVFITSESYLKLFISAFEKDREFKNQASYFVKEKLMVCASLIQRRIGQKMVDQILDQKGEKIYTGPHLTLQEHAFILRGGYPESYIKFIQREDWFLHIEKSLQMHFQKDKSLKSKEARAQSLWNNVYRFIKGLLEELGSLWPQTNLNGTQNLWIVKPGGLSRGRKIRIFDNYADICRHAELPFLQNPNGMQAFEMQTQGKSEQPSWTQKSWVAQKYIENPLIILQRKFDIRVWVVVASWNPLKVYYYPNCYVRFSAHDYDPKRTDNLFSHLTNNAITAKQIRIGGDRNFDKIPGNMWYLEQLKEFLNDRQRKIHQSERKKLGQQQSRSSEEEAKAPTATTGASPQGTQVKEACTPEKALDDSTQINTDEVTDVKDEAPALEMSTPTRPAPQEESSDKAEDEAPLEEDVWDTKLKPQLIDILRLTFISGWGYVEWREGSIGIYGLDIMVDTDLRLWLIEVNKSPCMAYSTGVTRTLIPSFMEDLAKVMVDGPEQAKGGKNSVPGSPKQHHDTGDLELILECPFIKEPVQEIRHGGEYTVHGQRIANPNPKIEKGKYPGNKH